MISNFFSLNYAFLQAKSLFSIETGKDVWAAIVNLYLFKRLIVRSCGILKIVLLCCK